MLEQARVLEADDPGLVAANAAGLAPRLLVIDDDHLHCTIICRVATRAGFAPVGAATYEAAAKLAQEITFDGMTLDLSLGAHAGVEMLRHLWVLGCKAPIIIISGCRRDVPRDRAHRQVAQPQNPRTGAQAGRSRHAALFARAAQGPGPAASGIASSYFDSAS
jgi:CheY-like chemotaxis protein